MSRYTPYAPGDLALCNLAVDSKAISPCKIIAFVGETQLVVHGYYTVKIEGEAEEVSISVKRVFQEMEDVMN